MYYFVVLLIILIQRLPLSSYLPSDEYAPWQVDVSRQGKKQLESSRDKNEGMYPSGEGGEEPT